VTLADPAAARPGTDLSGRFAQVPVDLVDANPAQPRRVFDEAGMDELRASIAEVGVLQPVVLRPAGDRYQLVMGERRLRAARLAGLTEIPAVVRDTADEVMLRDALLENVQRAQLNPLEEAAGYQQLLEDFSATHEELAAAVGKSRSHVTHTLSLLRLPASVQRRVAAGVLSAGHAKALVGVPEPSACQALAERIVAEGLSVRATEELIAVGNLPGWEDEHLRARRARRPRPAPAADLTAAASELGDRLDTTVRIEAGKTKGRIVIEFAGRDDLDRVLAALRPTVTD